MTDNIFTPIEAPPVDQTQGSALERLVGENKKFRDAEALAKAKEESDAFIESLKRETAELRKDLSTRTSLEKFLEDQAKKPNEANRQVETPPPNAPSSEPPATKTVSKDEILSLITEALTLEQTKATRLNNTREVAVSLQKAWGDNYVNTLKSKAVELGITEDWLSDIAARSPKALLALVGANTTPSKNPNQVAPPVSVMRQGVLPSNYSGERNREYWENMRRTDNKKYHSREMAVQRHNDAIRLGDAF